MQIEFFGAAGEVTGSCHIVHVNGHKLLLDCGMIQGGRRNEERNRDPFPFDPKDIDAVVLSHAHIDHSGRLPLLVRRGFRGPIYAQNATKDLCGILLQDSAYLQQKDTEWENKKRARKDLPPIEPLYTTADADRAVSHLKGFKYRERQQILPGVEVQFRDAGHILGSCIVEIWLNQGDVQRKIVFSGDLGQYDTPILHDPEPIARADLVLMESTYGARRHRDRQHTIDEIAEIIKNAQNGKGNIIIPAFAIGRSQEVLYQFGKHYDAWSMSRFQIFLDSPMAIEATEVYWKYPHLYDAEATRLREDINPMPSLPNLSLSRSAQESMAINRIRGGAIVLAGSGMCNGGRVIHHLKHNLWRREAQVIIVGYQANGSLGRRLVEGADKIRIHGDEVQVRAKIHTVGGLSAHGDQDDLARWYEGFENRPPIFLVHGEIESAEAFKTYVEQRCETQAHLSKPGLRYDLVSGKTQ